MVCGVRTFLLLNSFEIRIENYVFLQQYNELQKLIIIVYLYIAVNTTVAASNKKLISRLCRKKFGVIVYGYLKTKKPSSVSFKTYRKLHLHNYWNKNWCIKLFLIHFLSNSPGIQLLLRRELLRQPFCYYMTLILVFYNLIKHISVI